MAADPFQVTEAALEREGNGEINFDTDTFTMILLANTSNISTASDSYAALTGELPSSFGYTVGGEPLVVSWDPIPPGMKWVVTDAVWNATGGPLAARWCAIIDHTPATKRVIAFSLLDNTPADVSVPDGAPLTVAASASGVFTKVRA